MTAIGCLQRIEKFILQESKNDVKQELQPCDHTHSAPAASEPSEYGESDNAIEMRSIGPLQAPSLTGRKYAIQLQDVSFSWTETGEPSLRELSTDFEVGHLSMIVGPVASGKSTILKGILGEASHCSGTIKVAFPEIAYCEQTPWLRNATIRENIIGYSRLDEALYRAVLFACDLKSDMRQIPNGDQAKIGSNGMALSSGQKQRVALARAVYSQKQLLLLDDVFSQLDNTTSTRVFNRLFGPEGILKSRGSTTLLVSNAVYFLSKADFIVALGTDSTISQQGTFQDLISSNGYVSTIAIEAPQKDSDIRDGENINADDDTENSQHKGSYQPQDLSTRSESEDKKRQIGDFAVYRHYLSCCGVVLIPLFFVFQVLYAFFSTFPSKYPPVLLLPC